MKSLIIPINTNQSLKAKIKTIANHLNIHNSNELNTIQAIYTLYNQPIQLPKANPTIPYKRSLMLQLAQNQTQHANPQYIQPTNTEWEQPQNPQNNKPQSTQKIPFKNNQQTQNQIISRIIHILSAEEKTKTKELTNSAINMIINRLHKKGALIRLNGYYSLIPAFDDLENREQIVFRFEKE